MNRSNERMFSMLRSISHYIHEFGSDYKALQKLRQRWNENDVETNTLRYLFEGTLPNGSLMSRMLDKSSKFALEFSDLITVREALSRFNLTTFHLYFLILLRTCLKSMRRSRSPTSAAALPTFGSLAWVPRVSCWELLRWRARH